MALTDLDTRVALAVQTPQVDFNQLLNNSLDTYNTVKGIGQQGILSRLLAQNTGADGQVNLVGALQSAQTNPNQAYQSGMVNTLSGLIQQQNAAKLKAQQEAEKQRIDNAKTVAETRDKELGNTQKGQTLLSNLIATSTDATDAAKKLEILGSQYGLPPETIEATKAQLTGLAANNQGGAEAFENMRKSYGLFGTPDPIKYMTPEANTIANNEASIETTRMNNETSIKTTGMNNDASKYTADSTAKTAANKLEQDKILAEQELAFKNSEFDVEQGVDGVTYAVYKSGPNAGKVEPLLLKNNQPFVQKAKQSGPKLSDSALKQVSEFNSQLSQANQTWLNIGNLVNDVKQGNLNFSPEALAGAKARSLIGQSNANDLAIGRFKTTINESVNNILMQAKGTQTEGDAKRAAQIIAANPIVDNQSAMQALNTLAIAQRNIRTSLNQNIDNIYNNYGIERPQSKNANKSNNQTLTHGNKSVGGQSMSAAEVQQVAKKMGISVQEATQLVKSKGVNIQ